VVKKKSSIAPKSSIFGEGRLRSGQAGTMNLSKLAGPNDCINCRDSTDLYISGSLDRFVQVYLEVNRRQFKCDSCENHLVKTYFRKRRTYTKRPHSIIQEVLENDIHNVAQKKSRDN